MPPKLEFDPAEDDSAPSDRTRRMVKANMLAQSEFLGPSMDMDVPTVFSDDLKGVLQALRRRAWLFCLIFFSVAALSVAWLFIATPLYLASATVVIDPRKQTVTNSPEVLSDVSPDSSVIDTQAQLIGSRVVIGKAVDE